MGRGGKRPNSGRKKGQVTKATVYRQEMLARAASEGISPLEVMMTAMRKAWDEGNVSDAVKHAAAAAPYVHPRLANVDMNANLAVTLSQDEVLDELETKAEEASRANGHAH